MTHPTAVIRKPKQRTAPKTYDPRLKRAPPAGQRKWKSNDEILQAWQAFLKDGGHARNVQIHYPVEARVFMRTWGGTLVTKLEDRDIQLFIDLMGRKCSQLLRRGTASRCRAGFDVRACPLLQGAPATEFPVCPGYQRLDAMSVLSYLRSVQSLYQWLVDEGHVPSNPAKSVMARFRRRNRLVIEQKQRYPRRRIVKSDEVRRLIQGSPLRRAIVYALMAKCFLRIHEVMKLSLDPQYFDLKAGYIDIPPDPAYGDKRRGPNRIALDSELRRLLKQYLAWRAKKVKRDEDGAPVTDKLVITSFGKAWCSNGFQGNFRVMMHRDCVRLGIMTGREKTRTERLNTSCFRAYASTTALDRGANSSQVQVLRGDKPAGVLSVYDNSRPRLDGLYARFGPVLGL